MSRIEIWTDGACSANPGPGGWAVVLKYGEHDRQLFGHEPQTTNQQMELRAAIEALNHLTKPCQVKLYSDSAYLVRAMTEGWLEKWRGNGWRNASKKPIKNISLWRELDVAAQEHDIEWMHIKGHAQNAGNNRADALAYTAARPGVSE